MVDIERSYVTLGLKVGASPEEVKEAYRDLVKVWHPDRFTDNPRLQQRAQEKLKEINLAYDTLLAYLTHAASNPADTRPEAGTPHREPEKGKSSAGPEHAAPPPPPPPPRPGGASEGTRHPADGMRAVEWARAHRVFAVLVGVLLLGGALFRNELLYACVEHRFAGGAVTKWCTNRVTGGRWMLSSIGEWGDLSAHPATQGTRPTETPPVGASAEPLDLDVPPPTRKGDWVHIPPFTFGATKEKVRAAQGDGVLILDLSTNSYVVWTYGKSSIYFSRDGRVVGWYHAQEDPLNVKPEGFGYVGDRLRP